MSQSNKSLKEIADNVEAFNEERNWLDLEAADLAKSVVLEAAELLEHFQWDDTSRKRGKAISKEKHKDEIALEAADVFIYLLSFCREMKIDLAKAVYDKLKISAKKYPKDYAKKGGHGEYQRIKKTYRKNK